MRRPLAAPQGSGEGSALPAAPKPETTVPKTGSEPKAPGARASRADKRRPAVSREAGKALRKQVLAAEAEMKRLWQRRAEIDAMLASPQGPAERPIADLLKSRAEVERSLAAAEADWLAASEAAEGSR